MPRHLHRAIRNPHTALVVLLMTLSVSACSPALSNKYAERFVEPAADDLRVISTRVVIDDWWLTDESSAVDVVEHVSEQWERDFGIRFEVTSVESEGIEGLTAIQQVRRLARKTRIKENCQLVILFTRSSGLLFAEAAEILGNYVVIAPGVWDSPTTLLNHGLGHVFGAKHRLAPNSLMTLFPFPLVSRQPLLRFSQGSKDTILKNKWRSFERRRPRQSASADPDEARFARY